MPLFTSRRKESGIQRFIVALFNENCPAVRDGLDSQRLERRVNLTQVVMVVPVEEKKLLVRQAFAAITKEISPSGVAVVIDHPQGFDEAVLGFRLRESISWVRAKAKHMYPMGGGFFQVGFRMIEMLPSGDYPELAKLVF